MSAYPHGGVTDRKIRKGDLVTVDMEVCHKEYRTAKTGTFIVGQPSEKQMSIYETVLEANLAALDKIREGVRGVDVHAATSEVIEKAWLSEYFIHGLGHGVELEIYEGPILGKTSKDTITASNAVTDEPSIYIHGFGGVRIEDTVLVTKSEPERLTKAPKELNAILN